MANLAIGDKVRLNLDQSAAIVMGFPDINQVYTVQCVLTCTSPSKCGCDVAVNEHGAIEPSHVMITVQGLPDFFDAEWFNRV